jgi:hypothetical protein
MIIQLSNYEIDHPMINKESRGDRIFQSTVGATLLPATSSQDSFWFLSAQLRMVNIRSLLSEFLF